MASRAEARRKTLLSLATFRWQPLVAEVQRAGEGRITDAARAPKMPIALVLGAPLREGRVTAVLEDRVLTGLALLESKRVERLVLSGTLAEVSAMTALLETRVPTGALLVDPRGRHTFESIANARDAGHQQLLLVSQAFHLPRALFLARRLGLDAHGVTADRRAYQHQRRFEARERISCVLAYWMAQ